MVEVRRRLAKLNLQSGVLVLGDHEHSKGSDPALVLCRVSSPETIVDNVFLLDTYGLRDSLPQVCKDLTTASTRRDKVVVQTIIKSDLTKEHAFRH